MDSKFSFATRFGLFSGAVIALIAALALLAAAGLPDRADYSGRFVEGLGRVAPEVNALAPPFTQTTLSGDTLHLLDLRGESVVINFWATWCAPCVTEMPALQALREETGVRIVGVNILESHPIVAQWIAAHDITFYILLDPEGQIIADYQLRGQPSTFVVSPDGIITHIFYGPVTMGALREALRTHHANGRGT